MFRLRFYIGIFGWHVVFFYTPDYLEMIMYGFCKKKAYFKTLGAYEKGGVRNL